MANDNTARGRRRVGKIRPGNPQPGDTTADAKSPASAACSG